MQTFAVIVLIAVIIVLTHIHNWVIRNIYKSTSDIAAFMALFATIVYAIIMVFAFKYLILWGYPLITK